MHVFRVEFGQLAAEQQALNLGQVYTCRLLS